MSRLPLALVGSGAMGRRHLRGLAALSEVGLLEFDLVSICDLDRDAAVRGADDAESLLGRRPSVMTSLDDVLADDSIVALDIATEPSTHHRIAVPALLAGRHVLCEKPLSITVLGCRVMTEAAARGGAILAVEEQWRRGPANRVARAVIASGMLGEIHLATTTLIGGDDRIMLTAWRHLREKGAIGLDLAVHLADVLQYLLGSEFASVSGRGFIAEPVRYRGDPPAGATGNATDFYGEALARGPESVVATGEDSVLALYTMASGQDAWLAFIPSGPGKHYSERRVHGRNGSMEVPPDRTGQELAVHLDGRHLTTTEVLAELPDLAFDEATTRLFPTPTYADWAFPRIDAAHLAMTFWDFGRAIAEGRPAEVDGRAGTTAVAAILGAYESGRLGRAVTLDELLSGDIAATQVDIDIALGLRDAAGNRIPAFEGDAL
jgi:predicted dehydrogenase